MNRLSLKFLAVPFTAAALLLTAAHPIAAQDTAKQDMKDAGSDTKNAVKKTGHGIAKGTKTAATKTKDGTEKAAKATKNGTVKAYDKTKDGTKKVVHGAAKGTAKGADKVEDKTAPK